MDFANRRRFVSRSRHRIGNDSIVVDGILLPAASIIIEIDVHRSSRLLERRKGSTSLYRFLDTVEIPDWIELVIVQIAILRLEYKD